MHIGLAGKLLLGKVIGIDEDGLVEQLSVYWSQFMQYIIYIYNIIYRFVYTCIEACVCAAMRYGQEWR